MKNLKDYEISWKNLFLSMGVSLLITVPIWYISYVYISNKLTNSLFAEIEGAAMVLTLPFSGFLFSCLTLVMITLLSKKKK